MPLACYRLRLFSVCSGGTGSGCGSALRSSRTAAAGRSFMTAMPCSRHRARSPSRPQPVGGTRRQAGGPDRCAVWSALSAARSAGSSYIKNALAREERKGGRLRSPRLAPWQPLGGNRAALARCRVSSHYRSRQRGRICPLASWGLSIPFRVWARRWASVRQHPFLLP